LKTILTKTWLLTLPLAVTVILAACGGAGGGQQGSGSGSEQEPAEKADGMDHSQMNHGSMDMSSNGMARQMVMENGKYSDKAFIDAMIPHHQSAIEMAEVAYEKSKNPRIKELAENIMSAQKREIEQMKQWRKDWFPQG
jgi:uncharacterized protein (DUF305 family)